MRQWLVAGFGFALASAVVFGGLFFYSVSRPGLWLVVALGIAFYAILALAPRVQPRTRAALSVAFTSGACGLWLLSSSGLTSERWQRLFQLVTPLLAVPLALGGAVAYQSIAEQPKEKRPRMIPILILAGAGWLISYASSSHGGASPMVAWLMQVTGFDRVTAGSVIVVARKITHFCFYGCVALVGFRLAIRNGSIMRGALAAGLLAALTFAIFDESRQATEPDRGGSPWDVALDMSGAATAMASALILSKRNNADRPTSVQNSSTL